MKDPYRLKNSHLWEYLDTKATDCIHHGQHPTMGEARICPPFRWNMSVSLHSKELCEASACTGKQENQPGLPRIHHVWLDLSFLVSSKGLCLDCVCVCMLLTVLHSLSRRSFPCPIKCFLQEPPWILVIDYVETVLVGYHLYWCGGVCWNVWTVFSDWKACMVLTIKTRTMPECSVWLPNYLLCVNVTSNILVNSFEMIYTVWICDENYRIVVSNCIDHYITINSIDEC